MTLLEQVTGWMTTQKWKHDLPFNYEEKTVNAMTNYELLEAISDGIEKLKEK